MSHGVNGKAHQALGEAEKACDPSKILMLSKGNPDVPGVYVRVSGNRRTTEAISQQNTLSTFPLKTQGSRELALAYTLAGRTKYRAGSISKSLQINPKDQISLTYRPRRFKR